ncbi:unnamed protein product [Urochloa decumbens]|uniref:Protein kinase domain-containing protein n=1 Tax=Urochloa decumbens TaxID=240449 RepID=A0ABC8VS46_9POAL
MPLLLFHVLLLAVSSAAAYGGGEGTAGQTYHNDSPSMCHKSLPCGGQHVDIHYPFFLATNATPPIDDDDNDGHHPAARSYCGYPGMAVTCDGACAILRLGGHDYTILDISYENHTVMLADRDEVLNGGDCPRVTHNVTVPLETRLSLSATANDGELLFFYDCIFVAPPPPGIPPINCSGFPGGRRGASYVALESDVRRRDEWARACDTVVVVPVLRNWLPGPEYHPPQLNGEGYGKMLKRGFQLSWEPSTGPCYVCEQTKGKCSYNQSGEFVGCMCSDDNLRSSDCGDRSSKKQKIECMVSAISGAILLSFLICMCVMYSKRASTIESVLQKHEAPYPKRYTYSEVKTLTESFAHKLGKGGFGTVYKGNLPNGRLVAVKLLNNSKDDGQEFMNEVASIMRTSHVNVVTLLGYCFQGPKRALIYEYMPNGSLDRFAFGESSKGENSLSWERLFDIAVGIARGLEYLHRWCGTHIVHFDIKPHNILLDKDFCPKISDFGLAKLCMIEESIISINGARGTIGYIAPEVFSPQFGQISSKSDVYSYGMMILEMVGARENINKDLESSSKYFPQWVYEHLEEYCLNAGDISVDNEIVRKLIIIGLWCIQLQPNSRPCMTGVVQMLESRADDLQIPPQTLLC